jgi:alkanesulfonate monooxygenase SsuD/methylene tetrahydromethanopterin reductase-like flavin-dependent oxidoreductase (luciferase family)
MRKHLGTRGRMTIDELVGSGTVIVGSPKTVREKIERVRDATGVNRLVTMLQFGVLPDDLTKRNMEMFASEVMPKLRD